MWDVYISPKPFSPRSLSLVPSTKDWSAKNFITLGNHVNQLEDETTDPCAERDYLEVI